MVSVFFHEKFRKTFSKIKNNSLKERVIKHISKIKENPELGKPMKYARKGTKEVYVSPFRLSYMYLKKKDKIILLDLYHKDKQ